MLNMSDSSQIIEKLHPQGQTRIKVAATIVGVHHQTLRRWWKADKFPKPVNIHGILLFKNTDILSWLASHHVNSSDENVPFVSQEVLN